MLDVAQFFLPDACEFTACEQFFVNGVYEFDAGGGGEQVLALTTDIAALEESLYDSGSRRRPPDAVFLQSGAQFLVFYELAGRFHGSEQRRLGVVFGWCGPLFSEGWRVGACLSGGEWGQGAFFLTAFVVFFVGFLFVFCIYGMPSGVENFFAADLEF